jgi:hypothetical protein
MPGRADGGLSAYTPTWDTAMNRGDGAQTAMQTIIHQTTVMAADVDCTVHHEAAVVVGGRWLMRDGVLQSMDEDSIVREADRMGRAAWQRLFAERPGLTPPAGGCLGSARAERQAPLETSKGYAPSAC